MDCILCQRLESKAARLEIVHAERLRSLRRAQTGTTNEEYRRLQNAEDKARLEVEMARANVQQHVGMHPLAASV